MLIAAGGLLIMGPSMGAPAEHHGYMLGAASGILFGVSDVAIKAISGMVGTRPGALGLLSPWMLVCVAASVAAFYASAKGLQDGDAVPVIAVTGTAANVAGIVGGFIVFGDPLPGQPGLARRPVPRVRAGGRRGVADAGAGARRARGRRGPRRRSLGSLRSRPGGHRRLGSRPPDRTGPPGPRTPRSGHYSDLHNCSAAIGRYGCTKRRTSWRKS